MTQEAIAVSTTPPLPGLQMVQQVNAALQTIATDFAGPDDPAALAGPYMTWADTGNNLLKRRNSAGSAWVVEDYLLMGMEDRQWASLPIGHREFLDDTKSGQPIPPTDNPHFRYIKLSAGSAYNSGALASETVTGSSPNVIATAVISLSDSPLNGVTVNLINTEDRFIKAGNSGAVEAHQTENLFSAVAVGSAIGSKRIPTPSWAETYRTGTIAAGTGVTNSVGADVLPMGTGKTSPKNLSLSAYMRIK